VIKRKIKWAKSLDRWTKWRNKSP